MKKIIKVHVPHPAHKGVVKLFVFRMAESRALEDVFREFCSFGAKDAAPLMDGTKFAKLCKDMKLLDKNLTTTEVDIIFAKCKP